MSVLGRKVVRDLSRRRLRTALTILGIAIGVAGLVAVSTTARGLADAQQRLVESPDFPDLTVRTGSLAPGFGPLLSRSLNGATVETRWIQELSFSAGGSWQNSTVIGLETPAAVLARPSLISGRWPGPGEIALDVGVGEIAEVAIGDLVAIRTDAGSTHVYLRLVGFTRTPGAFSAGILNRAIAYTDAEAVEQLRGRAGPNEILVKFRPGTDLDQATADLARILDRRGVPHAGIERSAAEIAGSREMRTVVWLLLAFSMLGLVLSAVLVANAVAAIVLDETRQIGALKALGASRRRVTSVYVGMALALGAIGTVLGWAIGIAGGAAIVRFLTDLIGYPRPSPVPTPREAVLAAVVGFGVPLLAVTVPVWFAVRRSPSRLLGTFGLALDRGRRLRSGSSLRGRWALPVLAARNATRRRLRAGFTIALIAVAVAAAVAARALSASLDGTVASLYARYGADVWIAVDASALDALPDRLQHEPGVQAAERWARATGYGEGETIDLWGIPATTALYDARLVVGRWLEPGERRSAVASSALARRLDVSVGDALAVDLQAETFPLTIVGVVDDESTNLGSTAAGKLFVLPETLSTARVGGYSVLAIRLLRHDPASVDAGIASLVERLSPLAPDAYATYGDQASTERTISVVTVLLRAMVALVGSTGLIGVVNTLAMNLTERRREIGVMRSLGARRVHIALVVAGEGVVLGAYGFALGLVLGLPLALALVEATGSFLFRLDFLLPASFLAAAFAATLGACAVAATGPAMVAASIRPGEVLRYE